MEWQPISSAPKDGTWILVTGSAIDWDGETEPAVFAAQWTEHLNGNDGPQYGRWQMAWYDGGYYGECDLPTHWMPLPTPPQTGEK